MYTGIPIIAANMDTVGTFEMAKVLCKVGLLLSCFPNDVQLFGLSAELLAFPSPSQINSLAANNLDALIYYFLQYLVSSKSHVS